MEYLLAVVPFCIGKLSPHALATPLDSCSNRFCGVKFNCSSGLSMLLICVYLPSSSSPSYFTEYLNTLGELDGFIHSCHSDVIVIVGDFNVDFDRCCQLTSLLRDFMSDHSLFSCDLPFKDEVMFTYERDDGLSRSWIDHVLCSQSFSSIISNVRAVHSGSILSDHFPLLFSIEVDHLPVKSTEPLSTKKLYRLDWTRVTRNDIDKYCSLVSQRISSLQSDIVDCSVPDCSSHHSILDSYGSHLVSTLLSSALECFPTRPFSTSHRRLVGWNQSVTRLKQSSVFGIRSGRKLAAHVQGFSLKSRKVLNGDISMLSIGCCVGKMLCFKRS